MPDAIEPIQEVWTVDRAGIRRRVYRGRNPEHVAWKLDYHTKEGHHPVTEFPGEGSAVLPRGWSPKQK